MLKDQICCSKKKSSSEHVFCTYTDNINMKQLIIVWTLNFREDSCTHYGVPVIFLSLDSLCLWYSEYKQIFRYQSL